MPHRCHAISSVALRSTFGVLLAATLAGLGAAGVAIQAQGGPPEPPAQQTLIPGRNVNMVSGTQWPTGDPYLQRQNEPSIAASTRNPLHLLAGANDYRTVDVPFVTGAEETGDAWLGLFKSFDGGQRWQSTLLPGYPQDTSPQGIASPLYGYQAGADPVVRAGTNGLFYFAGLVFDREENGKNAIFVARFIDDNNKEAKFKEAGFESANDPVRYLGASLVARSDGRVFYDKPWMAVDVPRLGSRVCRIDAPGTGGGGAQRILAGNIYVAYTAFTEDAQGPKSQIFMTRSEDCGRTWLPAVRISNSADRLNQGATIAIDPRNGTVYVAWRRFSPNTASSGSNADTGDGFMVSQSRDWGRRFSAPSLCWALTRGRGRKVGLDMERFFEHRIKKRTRGGAGDRVEAEAAERGRFTPAKPKPPVSIGLETNEFDQATSDIDGLLAFRTNMYATMAVDGNGRVYLAWAERGYGTARPDNADGDARIVVSTSTNGRSWSSPVPVADEQNGAGQYLPGHQIMPSLTFGGGKLVLIYYDLREDISGISSPWIDDASAAPAHKRRTMDLRASFGTPGPSPSFEPSVRVSDYLFGWGQDGNPRQLQYNPPNLPMFKQGTAPFMGDYVDVTVAPAFVPTANGGWAFNVNGSKPVFHAVWTDNRDVRQPAADLDGDGNPWNDYTAPTALTNRTSSRFDPAAPLPNCNPLNTGSRNQNIYTARLTTGLVVGSPGNSKPLSATLQRAFVVFAQNTTNITKAFRLTIASQPPGGKASFSQFDPSLTSIDVTTPYRSTASRTVYVTSSDPRAQVRVDIVEIASAGATDPLQGGLSDVVLLNPDIANPDIANPDIANPDIANPDIANAEVYNPDIANPDIANPDIANPDIANPDIANPDIANPDIANPDIANPDIANPDIANPDIANIQVANPDIANPDIANPDIANPDIANPDIANPDIANPDIANPDIANASLTDVTWTMTNNGNTTAAFNVNLFLAQQTSKICANGQDPTTTGCVATQLVLRKVYTTPTAIDCELKVETKNVLLANVQNPRFVTPGSALPDQNDPTAENATVWLAPGETAKITLRVYDPDKSDNVGVTDESPETPTDPSNLVIDPIFLPTTTTSLGSVTPVVQQQSVDTADVQAVAPGDPPPAPPVVTPLTESVPPAQTPTPLTLTYVAQPSSVAVGVAMSPAVQVQVFDQYGAILPNWPVTLYFATNPANASLSGAVATTDALGVATFPALAISASGSGFTLAATSGTALPAVSFPFDATSPCDYLVVTTTADTGCGSLREAIAFANATAGQQTITFNIPGALPHVITPASSLPAITESAVIDGTSDPHFAFDQEPAVTIDGSLIGGTGLHLLAGASTVKGLAIVNFGGPGGYGIFVRANADGSVIQQNDIGTDRSHATGLGNNFGVYVLYADGVTVSQNAIAGNAANGILMVGGAGNAVTGNVIGTDHTGLAAIPNAGGIVLYDGSQNTVIQGNWISGNSGWGIDIQFAGAQVAGTQILGNTIGLDATGAVLGNTGGGVRVRNAPGTIIGAPGNGNVISGNAGGVGVHFVGVVTAAGPGSKVQANRIGTNPAGNAVRENLDGIRIDDTSDVLVGGVGASEGNLISGNRGNGIILGGAPAGTTIQGNLIGTDAGGNATGLGNGYGPTSCCYSGISLTGGATGTLIGGAAAGAGNLIADNNGGLWAGSGDGVIRGNTIEHNDSYQATVWIQGTANLVIAGNTIRSNAGIAIGLGGSTGGVTIGGAAAADANVITGNGSAGINLGYPNSVGVRIQQNQIWANGALGIDINNSAPGSPYWGDGPNPNDPGDTDTGANGLQNYPVLSNATSAQGLTTEVDFSFDSQVGPTYTLEFFASASCDPSGNGEGQRFLGSMTVAGNASGTAILSGVALAGEYVTATATDATGNTSEFSACVRVFELETSMPGTAGGTVNVNFGGGAPAAGGTAPVSVASLAAGQQVIISASGLITTGIGSNGPGGSGTGTDPSFLAPSLPAMSLVARIGNGPWQAVGAGPTVLTAATAGIVQVAVNDSQFGDNGGAFQVSVSLMGIVSASPSTVAAFQYLTLSGAGLPAVSQGDVLFSQGGPEFASDYLWSAGPTRVIARVPTGVLANGPATVRLKNPAGTVTTNAVPITIASTPGAPANVAVYTACFGGSPTSTLNAGQQFMIEADGTGTAGTEFSWTNGITTIPHGTSFTTGGPTGRVGTCATLPVGVSAGSWTLTIRSYSGSWSTGLPVIVQ